MVYVQIRFHAVAEVLLSCSRRQARHGGTGGGRLPLTSQSCPHSDPASPWSLRGWDAVVQRRGFTEMRRWSRGQTLGSCEDDGPGHVRRARAAKMEAGGGFSARSGGGALVLNGIQFDGRARRRRVLLFLQMETSVLLLWLFVAQSCGTAMCSTRRGLD